MEPLSQSHFLQALGYTLINSLWHFAILWLIYVFIHSVFKLSSHQKYLTGLLLQITGFGWFISRLYSDYLQSNAAENLPPGKTAYHLSWLDLPAVHHGSSLLSWLGAAEQLLPYLSIIYISLLLFFTLRWLRAYRYTQWVRTSGLQKAEVNLRLFVQRLSTQLAIGRPVSIFLSGVVKTPLTVGFFKPVILIPLASINHLSSVQMEAVILHELAHIRRYDYLFNLCLALIEVTLFFNPFMHLISRQIKKERENCCDDWVLQYEYNPTSYAHALLTIATFQSASPALALTAAGDKNVLLNRIKRMIEKKEKTLFHYRHQLMATLVILVVFSSVALISPVNKTNKADVLTLHSGSSTNLYAAAGKSLVFWDVKSAPTAGLNHQQVAATVTHSVTNHPLVPSAITALREIRKPSVKPVPADFPAPPPPPVAFTSVDALSSSDNDDLNDDFQVNAIESAMPQEDLTAAEKDIKNLITVLLKEKVRLSLQEGETKQETKASFERFLANLQLQIARLSLSARNSVESGNAVNAQAPVLVNLEKMKLISKQLLHSLDEAKQQFIWFNDNSNYQFNYHAPHITYSLPPIENETDLQEDATVRAKRKVSRNMPATSTKRRAQPVIVIGDATDDNEQTDDALTPDAPAKRAELHFSIHSGARIIKI